MAIMAPMPFGASKEDQSVSIDQESREQNIINYTKNISNHSKSKVSTTSIRSNSIASNSSVAKATLPNNSTTARIGKATLTGQPYKENKTKVNPFAKIYFVSKVVSKNYGEDGVFSFKTTTSSS